MECSQGEDYASGQVVSEQLKTSERHCVLSTHHPALTAATSVHTLTTAGQHCRGPIGPEKDSNSLWLHSGSQVPYQASWCANSVSLCNCCRSLEKWKALELLAVHMVRAVHSSRQPAFPTCLPGSSASQWVQIPVPE